MNERARAAVVGWQQSMNALSEQQLAALMPAAAGQQPPVDRGLTEHEMRIARQVFGDQLDVSQVRLTEGGFLSSETEASALPNLITFPAGTLSNPSPDTDFDAWLVHELTHQWQYQRGRLWTQLLPDAIEGDYDYDGEQGLRQALADGRTFTQFNYEEQAEIVRDYYKILRDGGDTSLYDPFVREVREGPPPAPWWVEVGRVLGPIRPPFL